jgi:transcriptional regulator EpsA
MLERTTRTSEFGDSDAAVEADRELLPGTADHVAASHALGAPAGAASVDVGHGAHVATLDDGDAEMLLLNLDAARKVHSAAQFFSWTQGLLQALLPHEVLICTLRGGATQVTQHVESHATRMADATVFAAELSRDYALLPRWLDAWKGNRCLPLRVALRDAGLAPQGDFAKALDRLDVNELVLHGCHDNLGEATSFFVAGCRGSAMGAPGPRELRLLGMICPQLHEAWMRVLAGAASARRRSAVSTSVGHAVITAREQEILRWIHQGKSNGEIGQILSISPLTVKNHVQKLLHKLDVVNRAQAVGKGLAAHLIGD